MGAYNTGELFEIIYSIITIIMYIITLSPLAWRMRFEQGLPVVPCWHF